jgi:hypothetical protein
VATRSDREVASCLHYLGKDGCFMDRRTNACKDSKVVQGMEWQERA